MTTNEEGTAREWRAAGEVTADERGRIHGRGVGIEPGSRYLVERSDATGQIRLTPVLSVALSDLTPELRDRLEEAFASARRGELVSRGTFARFLADDEDDDAAGQDPVRAEGR